MPIHEAYNLGLAHSLSRYKLKFSPDKVDTMIVQAINLLDELDKEVNIYAMRVREWFGWHFPNGQDCDRQSAIRALHPEDGVTRKHSADRSV